MICATINCSKRSSDTALASCSTALLILHHVLDSSIVVHIRAYLYHILIDECCHDGAASISTCACRARAQCGDNCRNNCNRIGCTGQASGNFHLRGSVYAVLRLSMLRLVNSVDVANRSEAAGEGTPRAARPYVLKLVADSHCTRIAAVLDDGQVCIYNAASLEHDLSVAVARGQGAVRDVCFVDSSDSLMWTAAAGGAVTCWDLTRGEQARSFMRARGPAGLKSDKERFFSGPFSLAVNRGGDALAIGVANEIEVVDIRGPTERVLGVYCDSHSAEGPSYGTVRALAWHPRRPHVLLSGGDDGIIAVHDTSLRVEDALVMALPLGAAPLRFGCAGPRASLVWAITELNAFSVWGLDSGERLAEWLSLPRRLRDDGGMEVDDLIGAAWLPTPAPQPPTAASELPPRPADAAPTRTAAIGNATSGGHKRRRVDVDAAKAAGAETGRTDAAVMLIGPDGGCSRDRSDAEASAFTQGSLVLLAAATDAQTATPVVVLAQANGVRALDAATASAAGPQVATASSRARGHRALLRCCEWGATAAADGSRKGVAAPLRVALWTGDEAGRICSWRLGEDGSSEDGNAVPWLRSDRVFTSARPSAAAACDADAFASRDADPVSDADADAPLSSTAAALLAEGPNPPLPGSA